MTLHIMTKLSDDALGQMIQRQFEEFGKKFDRIDQRLDSIETKMATKDDLKTLEAKMEARFDKIKNVI